MAGSACVAGYREVPVVAIDENNNFRIEMINKGDKRSAASCAQEAVGERKACRER